MREQEVAAVSRPERGPSPIAISSSQEACGSADACVGFSQGLFLFCFFAPCHASTYSLFLPFSPLYYLPPSSVSPPRFFFSIFSFPPLIFLLHSFSPPSFFLFHSFFPPNFSFSILSPPGYLPPWISTMCVCVCMCVWISTTFLRCQFCALLLLVFLGLCFNVPGGRESLYICIIHKLCTCIHT